MSGRSHNQSILTFLFHQHGIVKHYLKIAKIIFLLLAIGVFITFAWSSRDTLWTILNNAALPLLILSIVLWILLHFFTPLLATILFRGLAEQINYSDAFRIHAGRLPAKYLPGGIWHSVARVEGYHSSGVALKSVMLYLLIENLLSAGVTLSLGGVIVHHYYQGATIFSAAIVSIILVALGIVIVTPLVICKRFLPEGKCSLLIPNYILGISIALTFWVGASWSFLCFIQAMPDSSIVASDLQVMGVYLFSWGIGFITLFAPQGIGVSEYISSLLLQHGVEAGAMIVLLAGFRVVVLCADLITWAITLALFLPSRLKKRANNINSMTGKIES